MKSMVESVSEFLTKEGYSYALDAAKPHFIMSFECVDAVFTLRIIVEEEKKYIRSICSAGLKVKRNNYVKTCEYLTRANDGMMFGSFSLSSRSGEPTYVVAAFFDPHASELSGSVLRHLIRAPINLFEEYYSGLVSILHSRTSPSIAIKRSEKGRRLVSKEEVESTVQELLKGLTEPEESSPQDTQQSTDGSESPQTLPSIEDETAEAPAKRKRGRPRKNHQND